MGIMLGVPSVLATARAQWPLDRRLQYPTITPSQGGDSRLGPQKDGTEVRIRTCDASIGPEQPFSAAFLAVTPLTGCMCCSQAARLVGLNSSIRYVLSHRWWLFEGMFRRRRGLSFGHFLVGLEGFPASPGAWF